MKEKVGIFPHAVDFQLFVYRFFLLFCFAFDDGKSGIPWSTSKDAKSIKKCQFEVSGMLFFAFYECSKSLAKLHTEKLCFMFHAQIDFVQRGKCAEIVKTTQLTNKSQNSYKVESSQLCPSQSRKGHSHQFRAGAVCKLWKIPFHSRLIFKLQYTSLWNKKSWISAKWMGIKLRWWINCSLPRRRGVLERRKKSSFSRLKTNSKSSSQVDSPHFFFFFSARCVCCSSQVVKCLVSRSLQWQKRRHYVPQQQPRSVFRL